MTTRAIVLAIAVALAACGGPPPPAASLPPTRVVSLAPSITEIVFALGAGERVVGVCGSCDRPAAVGRLPRVGTYLAPSVEATLALRPDLVVAVPSPGNREAVRAMERAGLRVLVVRDRTLDDLWAAVHDLSAVLGVPAAGEALVGDVRARLDAVHARVATLPPRRVLVLVGHSPLVAVGGGSLQDELVRVAGGTNIAADAGEVWPTLTLELVVSRAPEVIVDAGMGTETTGRELFAGMTSIPAVEHGRIVRLDGEAFLRAGPRVPDAAAALAAAIHPEAFPG